MEPSYQTRKVIGRLLALLCAAGLAAAFVAYWTDPLLQQLSARTDKPITIAFFTQPAMRFAYNPANRKAVITIAPKACNPTGENVCFDGQFDLFFTPQETVQNTFWTRFKEDLASWRFNPAPVGIYLYSYARALWQKQTDINPAQLVALSLELAELTASDFAVEHPMTLSKKSKKSAEPAQPTIPQPTYPTSSNENRPLKVIVLNASGKRGLAESLKQYLRAQHAKGLLQVDVYDTGNYSSLQEHSFIEDYSGRLVQVTQISHAIGISGEIHSQMPSADLYYDSRIILGKDFKMPL